MPLRMRDSRPHAKTKLPFLGSKPISDRLTSRNRLESEGLRFIAFLMMRDWSEPEDQKITLHGSTVHLENHSMAKKPLALGKGLGHRR